jgi:hypothetical protein
VSTAADRAFEIAYSDESVEERRRLLTLLASEHPGDAGVRAYFEMFELERTIDD